MRFAVALAALVAAAAFATTLHAHHSCAEAREELFLAALSPGSDADLRGALRTVAADCRGTTGLVAAAGALRERDPARALRFARRATAAEPDNPAAWHALVAVAAGEEAARAEARLAELDPLHEAGVSASARG